MRPATGTARAAIAVALVYALLGGGCAGWQAKAKTILASTHEATKTVNQIADPIWDARCSDKAKACKAAGDTICKELKTCEGQFKQFNAAIRAVHTAIGIATLLIAVEKKEEALGAVAAATGRLMELHRLAKELGIF